MTTVNVIDHEQLVEVPLKVMGIFQERLRLIEKNESMPIYCVYQMLVSHMVYLHLRPL